MSSAILSVLLALGLGLGAGTYILLPLLLPSNASPSSSTSSPKPNRLPSYIIPSLTSHRRLLPIQAKHSFSYPLVYFGVDVDSLDAGELDLGRGWFRWRKEDAAQGLGGKQTSWWNWFWRWHDFSLLSLSPLGYLSISKSAQTPSASACASTPYSLKAELFAHLAHPDHGSSINPEEVGAAWLVTMPAYLGREGINPLSVWFVYAKEGDGEGEVEKAGQREGSGRSTPSEGEWVDLGKESERKETARPAQTGVKNGRRLLCVVLEVHNTFEERHIYVLPTTSSSFTSPHAVDPTPSHHHAWIFPRTFHVSPFNNRKGFYRLDVIDPFAPPPDRGETNPAQGDLPLPRIKITLHQLTSSKSPKLYAALLNHPSRSTRPPVSITPTNILRTILLRQPFDLLLTTPRILKEAWVLHFRKGLGVFPRPEPVSHMNGDGDEDEEGAAGRKEMGSRNEVEREMEGGVGRIGRGIGWQPSGLAERLARELVLQRMREAGVAIRIKFSNTTVDPIQVGENRDGKKTLEIYTTRADLFSQLVVAPSIRHFLQLTARDTYISDKATFAAIFSTREGESSRGSQYLKSWYNHLRSSHTRWLLSFCDKPIPPWTLDLNLSESVLPTIPSSRQMLSAVTILLLKTLADRLEEKIFRLIGAWYVRGHEPWFSWKVAVDESWGQEGDQRSQEMEQEWGSILRS